MPLGKVKVDSVQGQDDNDNTSPHHLIINPINQNQIKDRFLAAYMRTRKLGDNKKVLWISREHFKPNILLFCFYGHWPLVNLLWHCTFVILKSVQLLSYRYLMVPNMYEDIYLESFHARACLEYPNNILKHLYFSL